MDKVQIKIFKDVITQSIVIMHLLPQLLLPIIRAFHYGGDVILLWLPVEVFYD